MFWDAATALLDRPSVTRSTMMGFPCVRLNGDFFASWDPHQQALVVKFDEPTANDMLVHGRDPPHTTRPRHSHHGDVAYFYVQGEHRIEGEASALLPIRA